MAGLPESPLSRFLEAGLAPAFAGKEPHRIQVRVVSNVARTVRSSGDFGKRYECEATDLPYMQKNIFAFYTVWALRGV